ncbi:MAG: TIR domain-containing protein [Alphaproteobacteria bacterium]|nr:TIR domain-containing protein [Alphaproteobacteria bacterium]
MKNIFISHSGKDEHKLAALKQLIASPNSKIRDFTPKNTSPNRAHNEDYIKYKILKPRIEWSSVMIVLLTKNTAQSEFVTFEIEQAERLGKKIIGVFEKGYEGCEIPHALDSFGKTLAWDREIILYAINDDNFQTLSQDHHGNPKSARVVSTYNC